MVIPDENQMDIFTRSVKTALESELKNGEENEKATIQHIYRDGKLIAERIGDKYLWGFKDLERWEREAE